MLSIVTDDSLRDLEESLVSTLLERSPEVLPCLVRHGFTPLENPVMRATLAATVTLAQAVRIRGLTPEQAERMYADLAEVLACR